VGANADLILTAGRYIELHDGFSTEFGATLDVNVEYEKCNALKTVSTEDVSEEDMNESVVQQADFVSNQGSLLVFPNPSQGSFTVRCNKSEWMKALEIRNITGTLVFGNPVVELPEYVFTESLERGTYIIRALVHEKWIQTKLVVL
jgi:hypothetical protein